MIGHLIDAAFLLPVAIVGPKTGPCEQNNILPRDPRFLGRPTHGLVTALLILYSFTLYKSYMLFILYSNVCLRLYNTAESRRRAGWARKGRP
jgi:hypothetical protein